MTDKARLIALAERVEKAEAGSRELDVANALAVGWDIEGGGMKPFCELAAQFGAEWALETATCYTSVYESLPHYTTSLDAAMSLVPRGWIVSITRYFNNDGEYVSRVKLTDSFTVDRGCDPSEEVSVSSTVLERATGDDPTVRALTAASLRAIAENI